MAAGPRGDLREDIFLIAFLVHYPEGKAMTQPITSKQLNLLQFISKNPNRNKAQLITSVGASEADLAYLVQHDLIREREVDCFQLSHFGGLVLKRSL